ncbi:MAG TPA: hypothetical protein VGD56_08375 [Gemmatirosa sp.]
MPATTSPTLVQEAPERPEQPERPDQPERPEAPATPTQAQVSAAGSGAPRTARELAGLRNQRDELVQQLIATHARRGELVGEIEHTSPSGQGVLRAQMSQLDFRVLQLEKDVTYIDHAIALAPPAVAAEGTRGFGSIVQPRGFVVVGPQGPSANAIPMLLLLLLAFQLFTYLRGGRRRAAAAADDPLLRDAAARLARVEQAVDAIAIEVERVGEGQRFVTRALGDAAVPVTRFGGDGR